MRIPCLLLLSILASASIAPVAAQSSATSSATPTMQQFQEIPDFSHRAPEFQLQVPRADQNEQADPRIYRFQLPASLPVATLAQQTSTCYFIEAYHFARVTPESDAVRLDDVSTCQPAAQFRMRDVVTPR